MRKDQQFWGGEAVIGAAVAADYASTARDRNLGYTETNPLLGKWPSNQRLTIVGLGAFATYSVFNYAAWRFSHKDPSKEWRFIGHWIIPGIVAAGHGHSVWHNYNDP